MKLNHPIVSRTLAIIFTTAMWLLFRTLRLRRYAAEPNASPYAVGGSERFLYSVWHDSMVIPVFAGKHVCTTALTSHHADGAFVARILKLRRIRTVRGSTSRITTGALRDLLQQTESRHLVITPDGPRGPNRRMSQGIVYLASRSGRAIVPTAFACSRYWRFKGSWSDLIIPKPFARVVMLAGSPIHVAAGLKPDSLRRKMQVVQQEMDRLCELAERTLADGNVPLEGLAAFAPKKL